MNNGVPKMVSDATKAGLKLTPVSSWQRRQCDRCGQWETVKGPSRLVVTIPVEGFDKRLVRRLYANEPEVVEHLNHA